ncbi:hypothetical protein D3C79_716710 [compost metagenome]
MCVAGNAADRVHRLQRYPLHHAIHYSAIKSWHPEAWLHCLLKRQTISGNRIKAQGSNRLVVMKLCSQDVLVALAASITRELDQPVAARLVIGQHRISVQSTVVGFGHDQLGGLPVGTSSAAQRRAGFVGVLEKLVRPVHDLGTRESFAPVRPKAFDRLLDAQMPNRGRREAFQKVQPHFHAFGLETPVAGFKRVLGSTGGNDVVEECWIPFDVMVVPVQRKVNA